MSLLIKPNSRRFSVAPAYMNRYILNSWPSACRNVHLLIHYSGLEIVRLAWLPYEYRRGEDVGVKRGSIWCGVIIQFIVTRTRIRANGLPWSDAGCARWVLDQWSFFLRSLFNLGPKCACRMSTCVSCDYLRHAHGKCDRQTIAVIHSSIDGATYRIHICTLYRVPIRSWSFGVAWIFIMKSRHYHYPCMFDY